MSVTVLVTGAGHPKGIGYACAQAFARQGARVVISDVPGTENLETTAASLGEWGGAGLGIYCDLRLGSDIDQLFDRAVEAFGGVDVLVNNAGVGIGSPDFMANTEADWRLSLDINLMAVEGTCRRAIPLMQAANGGSIVNVASLSGLGAITAIPACYTASKFAVVGLTKQMALQYAADGIRINAVCPGSVRTQMFDQAMAMIAEAEGVSLEEAEALEASGIPLGAAALPEQVAATVAWLASEAASYVTGVAMPVAGGMEPGL